MLNAGVEKLKIVFRIEEENPDYSMCNPKIRRGKRRAQEASK